jgi:polyphosphate kinase 2
MMRGVSGCRELTVRQYEKELLRLQTELVYMQEWIVAKGKRLVVLFEGRDTAGKDGAIKRIIAFLNPRTCRVVAVPTPSERERSQWYFQRYVAHLPAAGEIVLFDRSWYNRAGVERVMGFCTEDEYTEFLRFCPAFEEALANDGIMLVKYWLSVSDQEQALEVQRHRSAGSRALGGLRRGQGSHVLPHRHRAESVARGRGGRQALGAS